MKNLCRLAALGLVVAVALVAAVRGEAATMAGTQFSNTAGASYADAAGRSYAVVSNSVTATVSAVGALTVNPKESACDPAADSVAAGFPATKNFTLTNTGNVSDAYTIATVQTSAGKITSVAFVAAGGATPVVVASTVSPAVQPGGSVAVKVVVDLSGVAAGTHVSVTLTARSTTAATANGLQSDTGNVCILVTAGAAFSGPHGAGTPVGKTVDGLRFVQAAGGGSVTYDVTFEDYSAVVLQNAIFSDSVPAGIAVDLASVKLDGNPVASATLNGQVLKVLLGNVMPNVAHVVHFVASVPSGANAGASFVNTATLAADNAPSVASLPAAVSVGVSNIVYDGYAGASKPIAGATIALIDPKTQLPVALSSGGFGVNPSNTDPFVTGPDGVYAFAFSPGLLGTPASPVTYDVLISAPGYANRHIAITLTPDASGLLYDVTAKALDGQALANSGGFTLTAGPVALAKVFGLFGNIPMFATRGVTLVKSVDRSIASTGDRLVWTLQYANTTGSALGTSTIVDTLPPGIAYAPGTGRVDGARVEPVVAGRALTWSVASLDSAAHEIVFASVLIPGVAEETVLTNRATLAAAIPGTAGLFARAGASADVRVIAGIFSACTPLLGRVFVDATGHGHFERGDRGLADVRLYIEDGESVTTDRDGRYSFACTRPGMHVIRLDETTLPAHTRASGDRRYDSARSVRRLVHGIFDGTTIEDINFAIEGGV